MIKHTDVAKACIISSMKNLRLDKSHPALEQMRLSIFIALLLGIKNFRKTLNGNDTGMA